MTHTIPETKTKVRDSTERVAGKARDALNMAKSAAKSAVQDKLDSVTDRTRMARDWASERMDAARDLPYELADRGADYVRARPYVMLGAALALGYLIGRLMSGDVRADERDNAERY